MPTYDYICRDCGNAFGVRMSMAAYSEGQAPACEDCGSDRVERRFGTVNVLSGSRGAGVSAGGAACGPGAFT